MHALHESLSKAGFVRQDAAHYAGSVKGYPAFATVINTEAGVSLLVAFRHRVKNPEALSLETEHGPELRALVAAGQARLSSEEFVAWLEWDGLDGSSVEKFPHVLSEVAAELDRGHAQTSVECCQQCNVVMAIFPDFSDGRVRRLCVECAEKQKIETARNNTFDSANAPLLVVVALIGALLTSLSWSVLWALYHEVFIWLSIDSVRVPAILMVAVGVMVAFGIAVPGTLLLRQVRRRGLMVGSVVGAGATLAGILIGEVFLSAWLLYRETGSVNPITAVIGFLVLWKVAAPGYTVTKLAVALLAVIFAFNIGKAGSKWIGHPLTPESNSALA
jgi:hypothetical protein